MKFIINKLSIILVTLFFLSGITSCDPSGDDEVLVPKPKAYPRMDIPKSSYQRFDSLFPFSFEYSTLSNIQPDHDKGAEPYWINIQYPSLGATIYLSYKRIDKNLVKLKNDAFGFANNHIQQADDIIESNIYDPAVPIVGKTYEIKGMNVASPYQFWVSDSTSKFVRGALYFNCKPNNDSLAPLITVIKTDILHMINTFNWNKKIK